MTFFEKWPWSERKLTRAVLHRDSVLGREVLEHSIGAKPAETGVLLAAKRHVCEIHRWKVVDVGHTGLDLMCEPYAAIDVACQHGARQTEFGIVRHTQRIRFILGAQDGYDRPKNLVSPETHMLRHVGEDMWRKNEPLRFAANTLRRTVRARIDDHRVQTIKLMLVDDRAHSRIGEVRIAIFQALHPLDERLHEPIVKGILDDHPVDADTQFALMQETSEGGDVHGLLKI